MTRSTTLTEIDAFWASWLGCSSDDLSRPGVWVAPCGEVPPHQQVFLFRRGEACIVSVAGPPDGGALMKDVEAVVGGQLVEQIFRGDFWMDCFGGRVERTPIAGVFEGNSLVAAAGYEVWGGHIAHIGVVTHPTHRGKGHGKAVVVEVSRDALANGLVLQYRTLTANAPSVAIARALGFRHYADSISVRVHS